MKSDTKSPESFLDLLIPITPFFFASFNIFLLSDDTAINLVIFKNFAKSIVISTRLLFKIFLKFLNLMPLLPPLAGITIIIFFTKTQYYLREYLSFN